MRHRMGDASARSESVPDISSRTNASGRRFLFNRSRSVRWPSGVRARRRRIVERLFSVFSRGQRRGRPGGGRPERQDRRRLRASPGAGNRALARGERGLAGAAVLRMPAASLLHRQRKRAERVTEIVARTAATRHFRPKMTGIGIAEIPRESAPQKKPKNWKPRGAEALRADLPVADRAPKRFESRWHAGCSSTASTTAGLALSWTGTWGDRSQTLCTVQGLVHLRDSQPKE